MSKYFNGPLHKAVMGLTFGFSVLCVSHVGMAEDKPGAGEMIKPGPIIPDVKLPDLSPAEMKAAGEKATTAAAKLGWRIGCQTYTFKSRSLFAAIDQVNALGLHVIEAFPGQVLDQDKSVKAGPDMPAEAKVALKAKLKEANVTMVSYGVAGIPKDEAGARKLFEWAREMGLETIVSEPDESQFDLLNKLVDEYKINVAMHNHPNPSHYWNPDTVLKVIKDRSNRLGSCADVGHWQRSGINPIEAIKKLEGHIFESHFKDLNQFANKAAHDVPWGTGVGNAKGMLEEFKRQNAKIVFLVENEHFVLSPTQQVQEVAHGIKFFGEACEALGGK